MGMKKGSYYAAQAAHKRNQEKAAYKKQKAARSAFLKANSKKLIAGGIGAVALIVVIVLLFSWCISLDGHIPIMLGKLNGAQTNWLVTNMGTTSKPSYYKLGEFDIPEGYVEDDENSYTGTSELSQSFWIKPSDENSPVSYIYVCGVKEHTAEEMLETVMGYGLYETNTEVVSEEIDGKTVWYTYAVYDSTEYETDDNGETIAVPDEERLGYATVLAYMNTKSIGDTNNCILVSVNSGTGAYLEIPTEEELLSVMKAMIPNVTPAQ